MATVAAQSVGIAGANPTMSSASGGGDVVPTGDRLIPIVCSGATTANLTIVTPNTVSGLAIADEVVAIPANAGTAGTAPPVLITLPTSLYGDANGNAALSWSATTGIKFAVVQH
jgi:hypothetical protein